MPLLHARHAINDLKKHGVGVDHIVTTTSEDFPTSMVLVNAQNGSRTIMHYRGYVVTVFIYRDCKVSHDVK